jgi:transposase
VIEVLGRRYECQACEAVLLVVPGGILRRRLYSAAAIALALAVWSLEEKAPAEVRTRVSPWRVVGAAAAGGWASLRRWAKAVRGGRLFPVVRALPDEAHLRQVAVRTATTLAALVPSSLESLPLTTRAMLGAAHVI